MTSDDGREMTPTERKLMAAVLLFFGMFVLAMAFGWIRTEPSRDHTPLWVLISAGMVFNMGGVLILLVEREGVDTLRNLVVWLFLLALAMPFNWIAFGAGERNFSSSVGGMGVAATGAASTWSGRVAFGFFALLMDAVLVWSVVRVLRGNRAFDKQENP